MKAKFRYGLEYPAPILLKYVVSMDNANQTKNGFVAFIDLVNIHNKNKTQINHLQIILTCHLQRHYGADPKALEEKWKQENEDHLKNLQNIPYEIIEWKTLLDTENFKTAKKRIINLYKDDKGFSTVVNNLVSQHAHKSDDNSAKKYLIEECAVILSMETGHFAYPAKNWNIAVDYVIQKFSSSSNLIFHGYSLTKGTKDKEQLRLSNKENISDRKLANACLKTSFLLNQFGIHGTDKQSEFFNDFLKLKNTYTLEDNMTKDDMTNTSHVSSHSPG